MWTSRIFRRGLFICIFIPALCFSCSSTEENALKKTYKNLVVAIKANDTQIIQMYAPFLLEEENQEAYSILKNILAENPSYKIRMLSTAQGIIQLSDPSSTILPFTVNEEGNWVMSKTIQRTQFIDIVPADSQ